MSDHENYLPESDARLRIKGRLIDGRWFHNAQCSAAPARMRAGLCSPLNIWWPG
jgi:hypothetical protein